jgi:hypothetical protein
MDLIEKDRADLGRPIAGFFSQADLSPRVAPDSDFAVPAFLKSDKVPNRTVSDSAAKQAEPVFAPKSVANAGGRAFPGDGRPARILPSLAPTENPVPERGVEGLPQAKAERRRRGKDASSPAPQPSAAKADRAEPINARKKRSAPIPGKDAAKRKLAPAPSIAFATPSATPTPAPPVSDAKISHTSESAARDKQRGRRWAGGRRNRDNAAALPPGQQWKRRLNPRAW